MEMHRPLMLLPPVSVTLHSLCTLDESCREAMRSRLEVDMDAQCACKCGFGPEWQKVISLSFFLLLLLPIVKIKPINYK